MIAKERRVFTGNQIFVGECNRWTEQGRLASRASSLFGMLATATAGEIVTGASRANSLFGMFANSDGGGDVDGIPERIHTEGETLTATGDFPLKLFFILSVKYGRENHREHQKARQPLTVAEIQTNPRANFITSKSLRGIEYLLNIVDVVANPKIGKIKELKKRTKRQRMQHKQNKQQLRNTL